MLYEVEYKTKEGHATTEYFVSLYDSLSNCPQSWKAIRFADLISLNAVSVVITYTKPGLARADGTCLLRPPLRLSC